MLPSRILLISTDLVFYKYNYTSNIVECKVNCPKYDKKYLYKISYNSDTNILNIIHVNVVNFTLHAYKFDYLTMSFGPVYTSVLGYVEVSRILAESQVKFSNKVTFAYDNVTLECPGTPTGEYNAIVGDCSFSKQITKTNIKPMLEGKQLQLNQFIPNVLMTRYKDDGWAFKLFNVDQGGNLEPSHFLKTFCSPFTQTFVTSTSYEEVCIVSFHTKNLSDCRIIKWNTRTNEHITRSILLSEEVFSPSVHFRATAVYLPSFASDHSMGNTLLNEITDIPSVLTSIILLYSEEWNKTPIVCGKIV